MAKDIVRMKVSEDDGVMLVVVHSGGEVCRVELLPFVFDCSPSRCAGRLASLGSWIWLLLVLA